MSVKLFDLNKPEFSNLRETCAVCIVGAGAAGVYLADRLSRLGHAVILLEAGGKVCGDGVALGMQPVFSGERYRGATEGRAFGFGGSTSRWGGLLVPHSEHDIRYSGVNHADPWKHIVSVVTDRTNAVLANLGLGHKEDFALYPEEKLGETIGALKTHGLETIAAEFLPFSRRNLTFLLKDDPDRLGTLSIYLNAIAVSWKMEAGPDGESRVKSIGFLSPGGNRLQVSAPHNVIAAGTIESARILLEIKQNSGEKVFDNPAAIGCCLSDHLSCRIADVPSAERTAAARLMGPRFARGKMRSFRFVESGLGSHDPRCFAHFIFDIDNPAFSLAKELLFSLQSRTLPKVGISDALNGISGMLLFAHSRYVRSELYIPDDTPVHLQMDIEQEPVPDNAVSLGKDLDQFGRPVAEVRWHVGDRDYENIIKAADRMVSKWPGKTAGLPELQPSLRKGIDPKPHDAYHPVGTCKLGVDRNAVVDPHLRVYGTENLWVLSTGVLPSAGTANPTFSMLCLGDELANLLSRKFD